MTPLFALDLARRTLRDAVGDLDLDEDAHRAALPHVVEAMQRVAQAAMLLEIREKKRAA